MVDVSAADGSDKHAKDLVIGEMKAEGVDVIPERQEQDQNAGITKDQVVKELKEYGIDVLPDGTGQDEGYSYGMGQ